MDCLFHTKINQKAKTRHSGLDPESRIARNRHGNPKPFPLSSTPH